MGRLITLGCRGLGVLLLAGCSLVGDSKYWIVEVDSGALLDAGPPDAGAEQTLSCLPRTAACQRNADCCGFAGGDSLCVRATQAGGSVCLATCASGVECLGDELCTRIAEGAVSVCAPQ